MSDYYTNQPDAGELPLFRTSDPPESRQSASYVMPKLGCIARKTLQEHERSSVALTHQEAAAKCSRKYGGIADTYRKRSRELAESGIIVSVGKRACNVTGQIVDEFEVRK